LPRHKLDFQWEGEQDGNFIDLVSSKKHPDDCKRWLDNYDDKLFVVQFQAFLTYNEFVNEELIDFFMSDIMKSIPNMMTFQARPAQDLVRLQAQPQGRDQSCSVLRLCR
jgi:hypothetical protein